MHAYVSAATRGLLALALVLMSVANAGCVGDGIATPGAPAPPSPAPPDLTRPAEPPRIEDRGAEIEDLAPSAELEFLIATELEREGKIAEALEAYERVRALDPSAPVLRRMAELSVALNRPEDALDYAEAAFEAGTDDLGLRLFMGSLYAHQEDVESALRVLAEADGTPVHPDAAMILYGALFVGERVEEARDVAAWLEAEEPENVRGSVALSSALIALGQAGDAEQVLRDALERHPGNLRLYGALAESRRTRGDRIGEIGVYREILAFHPDHHATLIAMADVELQLERREAAVATLTRIEEIYPDDVRATLRLAFLDFEAQNWVSAERRFERALEAFPGQSEVGFFLGIAHKEAGNLDTAISVWDDIEPEQDRYVDARLQIAALYEERDDVPRALESVDRALEVEPRRQAELYRATLLSKLGDVEGALAYLDARLESTERDADLLYHMGILHGENGDRESALEFMERALEMDDEHAGALNYVGYSLAERGENLDQAEELIERALAVRPDDGFIADSLGWVFFQRAKPLMARGLEDEAHGWLLRAESELLRAAELSGGDPVISEHLGDVYRALGRRQEALNRYEEALRQGPRPGEQPDLESKRDKVRHELATP